MMEGGRAITIVPPAGNLACSACAVPPRLGGMSGPLQGIWVVDLTRVMSGPFASMMLSDLGAHVFIENFRPGVCEAMDLGAERLRAVNPDLIYASISGYGPDGPAARELAYDTILQGSSGMIARQVNADGVLEPAHRTRGHPGGRSD
jgi:crotonobetainyl-CoA:carnitine CoA-transferase CaiB-like acyl-CoA transferase